MYSQSCNFNNLTQFLTKPNETLTFTVPEFSFFLECLYIFFLRRKKDKHWLTFWHFAQVGFSHLNNLAYLLPFVISPKATQMTKDNLFSP
jgi:hypothetical protein